MRHTSNKSDPRRKSRADAAEEADVKTQYDQPWITDGAWITGIAGTVTILLLGYVFGIAKFHSKVWTGRDWSLEDQKYYVTLAALGIIASVMFAVELIRLRCFDGYTFKKIDPLLTRRKFTEFAIDCVKRFLLLGFLFYVCRLGYMSLNEYGFRQSNDYYQIWFYVLDALWTLYLIAGLPYILITRSMQYDQIADSKDYSLLTEKCLRFAAGCIPGLRSLKPQWSSDDGRCARGLAVKFFFAPVMTVFFFDNFGHLQSNFDYFVSNALPAMLEGTYNRGKLSGDLGNFASTIIFTIDVGLAWCGYIITSRWVNNQTVSAEPTFLGWIVCLISYPPFRIIGGWFYSGPGEHLYSLIPNETVRGILGTLMMMSYFFYMLPTIWFGLRFSNLTHRGIIRKGPFALVRHPAYAAKNFGWWVVGFPASLWVGYNHSWEEGTLYLAGLILLSLVYWTRAITEERHLSLDPDYREYCRKVPYRFIPKIL